MHNVQQCQCCIIFFFSPKRKCERLLTGRKFEARSVDLHLTESNRLDELAFFIVLKSFMELKRRGYHTLFRNFQSWLVFSLQTCVVS